MKIAGLFIGWTLLCTVSLGNPDPDSALWAATLIGNSHQQQALANLERWESINLVLVGKAPAHIPDLVQEQTTAAENLWWDHASALPDDIQDSIQHDLGLLELLSQTIHRTDREAFALRIQDPPRALASLAELSVAVEDANIVLDRLRYRLLAGSGRLNRGSASSPVGMARSFFGEGMDQVWNLMEGLKTGRRVDVAHWSDELKTWRRQAGMRRAGWRQAGGNPEAEEVWRLWEQKLAIFHESIEGWLSGEYPAEAIHMDWSRNYLWYNHECLSHTSAKEGLVDLLLRFWVESGRLGLPAVGLFPAFRPIGIPEEVTEKKEATSWIFVVDVSGSMRESNRLPLFRQALATWIARQPGNHQISLISFSDTAELLLREVSASSYQDVLNRSGWMSSGGDSDVLPAMELAATTARQSEAVSRIVLVSDGGFRYDQALAAVIEELAYESIVVDAVFMPGGDPRYEAALSRLIGIGLGRMIPLQQGAVELQLLGE